MKNIDSIRGFIFCIIFIISIDLVAQRRISEESRVFTATKSSVFTVYGDKGHGSGFLIDESGLVLTNHHVVSESNHIRVQVNDSIKVDAKILASDPQKDISVLVVHPDVISGIRPLKLTSASDTMVFVGEKVIAIGSPLNQVRIMTAGIVSKVEPNVVISDVNINPGNSGGPLINMNQDVIGINTFGDFSNRGPGISGSLLITEAENIIEKSKQLVGNIAYPSKEFLPVMPSDIFPLEGLKSAALVDKFYDKPYLLNNYSQIDHFNVRVSTPPYDYYRAKRLEMRLADKRKARETNAGSIVQQGSYDRFGDLKEWAAHTGEYSPVVTIEVEPKIGQTSASQVGNLAGAFLAGMAGTYYRGVYTYEFKGDLSDFILRKNGKVVTDIQRSVIIQPLVFSSSTWDGTYRAEDMAQVGTFQYPISIFTPENGVFPSISLEIHDLKSPNNPIHVTMPEESIKKVWSDFSTYTGDYSYVQLFEDKAHSSMSESEKMALVFVLLGAITIILLTSSM